MARRRRRRNARRRRQIRIVLLVLAMLAVTLWYVMQRGPTPDVVARVLFSETAGCTSRERMLVAAVMKNRVGNAAFGNYANIQGVVLQPGAFSCIDDPANGNWQRTRQPSRMTARERTVWQECVAIAHGAIPPAMGPSGRLLVYYHDKSIGKPASWDNRHWHAMREVVTEHFVFYSILPVEGPGR